MVSLLAAVLASASAAAPAAPARDPIVVLVHPKNPSKNISLASLRDLFLKTSRRWSDGKPVMPLNHKAGTKLRKAFDRAVLKLSPEESASYWIKQRVRGRGYPPRSFRSQHILLRLVAKQREAVTYLRLSSLKSDSATRVLRVAGKLPGERGYPLALKASK